MSSRAAKPGWVCPACGRRFARTNQGHVCETWSVDDLLRDLPAASLALYERFVALVSACGPFEFAVTKHNIGFRGTRRIFAGTRPTDAGLTGYLDLTYAVDDPRIRRVSPYTKRLFVNTFVFTTDVQLDEQVARWICDAYAVGQGAHLT